jgi:hypothetical protein
MATDARFGAENYVTLARGRVVDQSPLKAGEPAADKRRYTQIFLINEQSTEDKTNSLQIEPPLMGLF